MSRFSMTEDLRDCHADELPRTKSWLSELVRRVQRFARGAARARSIKRDQLAIYDALIVKYAPDLARDRAASGQPCIRDFSTLTLNVALSDADDFIGGGTRFEGPGDVTLTPVKRRRRRRPRRPDATRRRGDDRGRALRPRLFFGVDGTGPRALIPGAGHGFATRRQVRAGRARRGRRFRRTRSTRPSCTKSPVCRCAGSPTRLRDEGHGWPRRWPTPRRRTSRKRQAWRPTTSPRCTASRRWRSRALRREKTSGPPRACRAALRAARTDVERRTRRTTWRLRRGSRAAVRGGGAMMARGSTA